MMEATIEWKIIEGQMIEFDRNPMIRWRLVKDGSSYCSQAVTLT
jgi:hypothetical protein